MWQEEDFAIDNNLDNPNHGMMGLTLTVSMAGSLTASMAGSAVVSPLDTGVPGIASCAETRSVTPTTGRTPRELKLAKFYAIATALFHCAG